MRLRLAVAAVVLAAAFPTSASAAVQFIDQQPASVARNHGAKLTVEVLNGSPRTQKLALRVLGAPSGEFEVIPAGADTTEPVQTRSFAVVVAKPPKSPADRTLLATSSDGTSARLSLRIGKPATQPLSLPKRLDLGTGYVGDTRTVTLPELPASTASTPVGRLTTTGGDQVVVTVEAGSKLKVAPPGANGTYTGDVDVNGPATGGMISLTLNAKDKPFVPVIVLLIGIGIGFVIEWWLTRWRPRSLLDRRLGRLIADAEARRKRMDAAMRGRFLASRPPGFELSDQAPAWAVPQIATTDRNQVPRYYLARAGNDLARRLRSASTDPERELFGPDGDVFKALLGDAETYGALVGDLLEAARVVKSDFEDLRNSGPIGLRKWFDVECRKWIIGDDNELAARRESAKALRAAAEKFAEYRRRLKLALGCAAGTALSNEIEAYQRLLDATFRGDADQVDWWDKALPNLEAQLEEHVSTPAAKDPPPGQQQISLADPPGDLPPWPPPGNAPAQADTEPEPPWDALKGVWRQSAFGRIEALIGAINLLIVTAAGLSAGYLAKDTFGSPADYLALLLWGSTATAGLALLRRLLPGALTTVQPGTGG